MKNRDVRPQSPQGPVKVKPGDFDPEGSSATPIIDDRPPHTQGTPDPTSLQQSRNKNQEGGNRRPS
jgi:hypothetical protein